MKRLLLLSLLVMFAAIAVEAQNRPVMDLDNRAYLDLDASGIEPADTFWKRIVDFRLPNLECKYDISISHLPLTTSVEFSNGDISNRLSGSPADGYSGAHTARGPDTFHVLPYVTFMVKSSPRIELGASTIAMISRSHTYNVVTHEDVESNKSTFLLLSPTARWNMIYSRYLRAYLITGMDLAFAGGKSGLETEASGFVGCGTTIGARIYLFGEARVSGIFGCGIVGIGYRF